MTDTDQIEEEIKGEAEDITETSDNIQNMMDNSRLMEAVLFASSELIEEKVLAGFFEEGTDLRPILHDLTQRYKNRGIQLVHRGSAWGFRTAPDLADRLQSRQVVVKPLSKAATEILSIIAYHQPVTKAEMEQIRGVSISKSTMDILIQENWVRPGKRRQVPGRPLTWVTTQHFLDHFGLEGLSELPNLKELKEAGFLEKEYQPELHGLIGTSQADNADDFDDSDYMAEEESDDDINITETETLS